MLRKSIFVLSMVFIFSLLSVSAQDGSILRVIDYSPKDEIVPPDMEHNYEELLLEWKKSKQYAECSSINSQPISEHDSVYINRLYSLPTEMELAYNSLVRDYIEMYAGRRREQVSYMLGAGTFYFPIFENILDKEGLPMELKYLPVIESALNPGARSKAGAMGLWQFMAGTGKMYNLEINSLVDERRDIYKSSQVAAKYLKDLYAIYKDWNLVIAAYNCGPGNVNKAIRRSGGKRDYWAIFPYLPRETRGYVPAFIATNYIMSFYEEHNICPVSREKLITLDTLSIDKRVHFNQLAAVLDMDIEDLRKYNPQFKKDIVPGDYKEYVLSLPLDKIVEYIKNQSIIYSSKNNELLAHRKTVDVGTISSATRSNTRTTTSNSSTLTTISSKPVVHTVEQGETLSSLAQRYGVTITQIREWNNLRSTKLSIGKKLSIVQNQKAMATTTPSATRNNDVLVSIVSSQSANQADVATTSNKQMSEPAKKVEKTSQLLASETTKVNTSKPSTSGASSDVITISTDPFSTTKDTQKNVASNDKPQVGNKDVRRTSTLANKSKTEPGTITISANPTNAGLKTDTELIVANTNSKANKKTELETVTISTTPATNSQKTKAESTQKTVASSSVVTSEREKKENKGTTTNQLANRESDDKGNDAKKQTTPTEQNVVKTKQEDGGLTLASLDGATKTPDNNNFIYHKVKIGETIKQIANRYSVLPEDILTWNKLSVTMPRVGQRLLIYLPSKSSVATNG